MPAAARFAAPKGQRAGCLLTLHLLNLGGIVVEHKEVHALQAADPWKQHRVRHVRCKAAGHHCAPTLPHNCVPLCVGSERLTANLGCLADTWPSKLTNMDLLSAKPKWMGLTCKGWQGERGRLTIGGVWQSWAAGCAKSAMRKHASQTSQEPKQHNKCKHQLTQ